MQKTLVKSSAAIAAAFFILFSSSTSMAENRMSAAMAAVESAKVVDTGMTVVKRDGLAVINSDAIFKRITYDLLIIVEAEKLEGIQSNLNQYVDDLENDGVSSHTITFESGTVEDLKQILVNYYLFHKIKGAFLIGTLPAAWAERVHNDDGIEMVEEFPTDLFLMDLAGAWQDQGTYTCMLGSCTLDTPSTNSVYDTFPPSDERELEIFVSRLRGTEAELNSYLGKNHAFRTSGALLPQRSFLFVDDDWDGHYPDLFLLDTLYASGHVDSMYDETATVASNYLDYMENQGAEYVHQWIHSSPIHLRIYEPDGSSVIMADDIVDRDLKGSFFNLFDCSAHRFTEESMILGDAYLRTGYGLASVGSTKPGAMLHTEIFNEKIGGGEYWGPSFKQWYNEIGREDDHWHLGMSIMGDPMLTLSGDALATFPPFYFDKYKYTHLDTILNHWIRTSGPILGNFQQYIKTHKKFFHKSTLKKMQIQ